MASGLLRLARCRSAMSLRRCPAPKRQGSASWLGRDENPAFTCESLSSLLGHVAGNDTLRAFLFMESHVSGHMSAGPRRPRKPENLKSLKPDNLSPGIVGSEVGHVARTSDSQDFTLPLRLRKRGLVFLAQISLESCLSASPIDLLQHKQARDTSRQ